MNEFRTSTLLIKTVKILLTLWICMTFVALWADFCEYKFINEYMQGTYSSSELIAEAGANDNRQLLINFIGFLLLIITGIFFLIWTYRASLNVRALGASGMKFSPRFSVISYFLPLFFLWRPYQAMKEIYQASMNPDEWHMQCPSMILPVWWFTWLLSFAIGLLLLKEITAPEHIAQPILENQLIIAGHLVDIPLTILAITLVHKISSLQLNHYQNNCLTKLDH